MIYELLCLLPTGHSIGTYIAEQDRSWFEIGTLREVLKKNCAKRCRSSGNAHLNDSGVTCLQILFFEFF